ncbi:MAG: YjfB family protein [Planctomycetaceae bacterium]|jgi:hypothetical protein|nr:YjfB family protein [Planctomycetaceae bacterium]
METSALISSASQMQQQQIAMQTQVGLMKTALNTQKAVGEAIISLIDTASAPIRGKSPNSGQNLDIWG